jgi:calmodulin/calcium-dependent protein kinase
MSCDKAKAETELKKVFQKVDKDGSGFIDCSEVENVLREYYSAMGKSVDAAQVKREAAAFLKDVDKNQDNKASLQEFTAYIMQFCT